MYCVERSVSQPSFANSGVSYGPIMITLNELLCVLTSFWIAARRSPSVYVAYLTLIPGYCFSKLDVVSGIIWPVISGLDTTATVIVPESLLLLADVPPLEQAPTASNPATQPTAPSVRSLNGDDLMNEPPRALRMGGWGRHRPGKWPPLTGGESAIGGSGPPASPRACAAVPRCPGGRPPHRPPREPRARRPSRRSDPHEEAPRHRDALRHMLI